MTHDDELARIKAELTSLGEAPRSVLKDVYITELNMRRVRALNDVAHEAEAVLNDVRALRAQLVSGEDPHYIQQEVAVAISMGDLTMVPMDAVLDVLQCEAELVATDEFERFYSTQDSDDVARAVDALVASTHPAAAALRAARNQFSL